MSDEQSKKEGIPLLYLNDSLEKKMNEFTKGFSVAVLAELDKIKKETESILNAFKCSGMVSTDELRAKPTSDSSGHSSGNK